MVRRQLSARDGAHHLYIWRGPKAIDDARERRDQATSEEVRGYYRDVIDELGQFPASSDATEATPTGETTCSSD